MELGSQSATNTQILFTRLYHNDTLTVTDCFIYPQFVHNRVEKPLRYSELSQCGSTVIHTNIAYHKNIKISAIIVGSLSSLYLFLLRSLVYS